MVAGTGKGPQGKDGLKGNEERRRIRGTVSKLKLGSGPTTTWVRTRENRKNKPETKPEKIREDD